MMHFFRRSALVMFTVWMAASPTLSAAQPSPDACIADVNRELAQEQRIYRGVLFGHTKAKDAPLGETHYDKESNEWIKLNVNGKAVWRSPAKGFLQTTWFDAQMDIQDEIAPRRGIFEKKKVLTSELVPSLTQSVRALRCRLAAVCKASSSKKGTTSVTTPGCIAMPVDPMPGCQYDTEVKIAEQGLTRGYCGQVASRLMDQESELLKLAVAYDASYRTLLQFAGNFDLFLKEFRVSLLTPIRQAVGLLGQLNRIPCFTSQCDE